MITFRLEGVDKAIRDLDNASGSVRAGVRQQVGATSDRVVRRAASNAPRDTGQLSRSIKADPVDSNLRAVVGIDSNSPAVTYAPVIEFGWRSRGINPSRFMRTAADSERKAHDRNIKSAVKSALGA